jgi:hypothetical protein
MKAVFVVILFASYIMTQSEVNAVPSALLGELNKAAANPNENNIIEMMMTKMRSKRATCPHYLCRMHICPLNSC